LNEYLHNTITGESRQARRASSPVVDPASICQDGLRTDEQRKRNGEQRTTGGHSMSKDAKGISVYLTLSFGLAWLMWVPMVLVGVDPNAPVFQALLLPGGFAPAIAAILVRKFVTREGFADAGLKPNFRHWRLYLFGWLWTVPVVALIILLAYVFDLGRPDFTAASFLQSRAPGKEIPATAQAVVTYVMPLQGAILSLIATFVLWGEEFGWRSYLQPRLFARRPLAGAIVTGLIWGVWHFPLVLLGYQYPQHPLWGLAVFPISTVLISIVFGWLRSASDSIWPVCLAHASFNSLGGSWLVLWFTGRADLLWVGILGVLGWIPLGALAVWIVRTGRLKPLKENGATKAAP